MHDLAEPFAMTPLTCFFSLGMYLHGFARLSGQEGPPCTFLPTTECKMHFLKPNAWRDGVRGGGGSPGLRPAKEGRKEASASAQGGLASEAFGGRPGASLAGPGWLAGWLAGLPRRRACCPHARTAPVPGA